MQYINPCGYAGQRPPDLERRLARYSRRAAAGLGVFGDPPTGERPVTWLLQFIPSHARDVAAGSAITAEVLELAGDEASAVQTAEPPLPAEAASADPYLVALLARLEQVHGSGGKAAAVLGIGRRTWCRWRSGRAASTHENRRRLHAVAAALKIESGAEVDDGA